MVNKIAGVKLRERTRAKVLCVGYKKTRWIRARGNVEKSLNLVFGGKVEVHPYRRYPKVWS